MIQSNLEKLFSSNTNPQNEVLNQAKSNLTENSLTEDEEIKVNPIQVKDEKEVDKQG